MVHSASYRAMGLQPFYGKGLRRLLWAGSRAARAKMTVSDVPNCQFIMNFLQYIHNLKTGPRATKYNLMGLFLNL
jgi:hypothetical protein